MTELATLRERCKQGLAGFVLASGAVTMLALVLFHILGTRFHSPGETARPENQHLIVFLAMLATVIVPNVIVTVLAVRWFKKTAVCITCKTYLGLPLIKDEGTCPECGFTWKKPEA